MGTCRNVTRFGMTAMFTAVGIIVVDTDVDTTGVTVMYLNSKM